MNYFASSEGWFWHLFPGVQPQLVWEEWGVEILVLRSVQPLSLLSPDPTSSLVDLRGYQWPRLHLASAVATATLRSCLEKQPLVWGLPKRNLHFTHTPPPGLVVVLCSPLWLSKSQFHLFPNPWCQLHNFMLINQRTVSVKCTSHSVWHAVGISVFHRKPVACWLFQESVR